MDVETACDVDDSVDGDRSILRTPEGVGVPVAHVPPIVASDGPLVGAADGGPDAATLELGDSNADEPDLSGTGVGGEVAGDPQPAAATPTARTRAAGLGRIDRDYPRGPR